MKERSSSLVSARSLLLRLASMASAQQSSSAPQQIAEAVQILPEDLRAGATVVTYDATGARKVLRQGTNFLECQPRMADGFSALLQQGAGAAPRSRGEAPRREEERRGDPERGRGGGQGGHAAGAIEGDDVVSRLRQARSDPAPLGDVAPQRHARIGRRVDREPARRGARRQGAAVDDAAGHAGRAHHDPDQPAGEDSRPSPTRPRTRSRRRCCRCPRICAPGATVYKYDAKTGERIVLRKGTNFAECTPRGADGFTWCYNSVSGAAPRFQREAARAGEERQGDPGGRDGGHQGRHAQADAVRHDVVPALWQEGSDSAAVGALGAGRHARDRLACPTTAGATNRSAATAGRG